MTVPNIWVEFPTGARFCYVSENGYKLFQKINEMKTYYSGILNALHPSRIKNFNILKEFIYELIEFDRETKTIMMLTCPQDCDPLTVIINNFTKSARGTINQLCNNCGEEIKQMIASL